MTADIAPTSSEGQARPEAAAPSTVVRSHVIVSVAFLFVAVAGAAISVLQLARPGFLGDVAFLSYGRLVPMVTTALLYGWLTIGFLGAVHHILPRVTGTDLRRPAVALASLALVAGGVAAGVIAIALGFSEGRPYLEVPFVLDLVIFVGLALASWVATATVRERHDATGPPQWYLLAATWWLVLIYVVGNFPGISGFNGAIQASVFRAGVTGMWFAAAGVGIAYYLVARLTGLDPKAHTRLSVLGFWSLAFAWALTGPRDYIYGSGPDWLETIGIAFSITLLLPVLLVLVDLGLTLRGRRQFVGDRVTLRFLEAGAAMFALIPVHNLLLALRSSSAVVQFTQWVPSFDYLAFFGGFSLWLFAFAYHVAGKGRGPARPGLARSHLLYTLVGLIIALGATAAAGLVGGFTWAAGVNSGLYANYGDGYVNTATALQPYYAVRAVGIIVFALAQVIFVVAAFGRRQGETAVAESGRATDFDLQFGGAPPGLSWRGLRYGALVMFLGVALVGWVLPSFDGQATTATILGDESRVYPDGSVPADGRALYLSEGCQYCHTQEVRAIVTDVGLGAVSRAGDYANETPILRGVERIGPDLMHAGSRSPTDNIAWVAHHLADPRDTRPWSIMPSYSYLSDSELDLLAAYVVSLE